jgi:LCP family protein required for cell wall assembly
MHWLSPPRVRAVLRVGSALLGLGVTGWLLAMLWPEPDRVAQGAPPSADQPETLAPYPEAPVTVLVIGLDADRLGAPSNKAAPQGPANADALLMLRIASREALQVLHLPTELGVRLPGQGDPGSLAQLWRRGGVSLVSDAVRDIVGLDEGDPKRYVVMPRAALRRLVDGLGEVEVLLGQSYQRQDKTQGYSVNLQAGRQSLNGVQAEQLVRYLPDPKNVSQRRQRQDILVSALIEQVKSPSGIGVIPALVAQMDTEIETNLSRSEQLSLAAAIIASPKPVAISRLPLANRAGDQTLRQIKPEASRPLWPQPQP